jgi:hypothetical protein
VAGETDLARMLSTLAVERRPGRFVFVTGDRPSLAAVAEATVVEAEGPTHVVTVEQAEAAGVECDFVAAWLTLTVHSSLEAVGLTAWFSARLAEQGIPCNVLAGFHHDHLLVPVDRVDDAVNALLSPSGRPDLSSS